MRLRYGIDGAPTADEDHPSLLEQAARVRIVDLRQVIRYKIDLLNWPCHCAHERRQKQFEDDGGDFTDGRFPLNVLCPAPVRRDYANCAHVEEFGRDPDPFGPEIRELLSLGVLDAGAWNAWLADMRFRILDVDGMIGRSIHGGSNGGPVIPLPDGASPELLQSGNLAELRAKGHVLLSITGRILGLQAV